MKQRIKLKGVLRLYLNWPVILTLLLVCMNLSILTVDRKAAAVMSFFVVIYAAIAVMLYFVKKPLIVNELVRFAAGYSQVQRRLLKELAIPYAVMDSDGIILWANDEFMDLAEMLPKRKQIRDIIPEVTAENMPSVESDVSLHVEIKGRNYEVCLRVMNTPSFDEDMLWQETHIHSNELVALYLYDETEIVALQRENENQRLITGLLYIDNYEEVFESIDEVRRSLLTALVDRKINKYMVNIDAIIKKLEKDKYMFVFQHKYLEQLEASKFSLLEEVRGASIGNDAPVVTISMGLGVNAESFLGGYELARGAIDLALGRGGNQAVVKDGNKISYYGGTNVQVEKTTRVKARVKAHALKEFVEGKDKVVIMGHSIGDIDSLGSAIGVYRIAKTLNKKAHIVINEVTSSIRPMLIKFQENSDYEDDMFVGSARAQEIVDKNTLLVVVDVNRPSYTECEALLSMTRTIVILDHHRQTEEAIPNAVLSYIEPYASSACEMVAEILQYIGEGLKLKSLEADAMYAGIMIDTNNFLTKTGVRTFEAAAYLRRNGADVTRIRKMFRTDLPEYHAKAKTVAAAEIFEGKFAFSVTESNGVDSPTVIAAQAANELLNINGVMASFVFTQFGSKIYVSARSIDEVNVQVVMEKLGGGGHISVAGAQFENCDIMTAVEQVKDVLRQMITEGEIKL
ncbi:MAG: DHH family phosphoesterase [Lachnospiraceae bacterium]|nr:DHH family phosphoesterase [Lachnospiraceae bacterium]